MFLPNPFLTTQEYEGTYVQCTSPPQAPISNTWIEASFDSIPYTHIPQKKLPTPHRVQTPAINSNDCHPWFFWKAIENVPYI